MHLLMRIGLIGGCKHPDLKRSLPFRNLDTGGHYVVCLGCGQAADYDFQSMQVTSSWYFNDAKTERPAPETKIAPPRPPEPEPFTWLSQDETHVDHHPSQLALV